VGSIDYWSKEKMDGDIGRELLIKHVSRVDLETGRFVEVPGEGTNTEKLTEFAKMLSIE
jgi:hypothetical protein